MTGSHEDKCQIVEDRAVVGLCGMVRLRWSIRET